MSAKSLSPTWKKKKERSQFTISDALVAKKLNDIPCTMGLHPPWNASFSNT
jgi:hypothetical protein